MGLMKKWLIETMRPGNLAFLITQNGRAVQRERSPEPYYETSSDESEVEQISKEHSDVKNTSQEQSEKKETSRTESKDIGPSKGLLSPRKRGKQMPVTEDRKKSRPHEKILPNLLIEKVGKQTKVGLDLTAIPIRDLGGQNPRRILMQITSVEERPSSGQAKLVLWDEDATNALEIQKIMNKEIFIESAWINWYNGFKGEYQVRAKLSEIALLKNTTKIHLEVNDDDEKQIKRIKLNQNEDRENEETEEEDEETENEEEDESDNGDRDIKKKEHLATSSVPRPESKKQSRIVFFDLETTGIDHSTQHEGVEICSIAASTRFKERHFKSFLTPTCNFQTGATRLNGMKLTDGKLYKHNQPVRNAVNIKEGLQNFLEWLSDLLNEQTVDRIVLVAHNCFPFDAIILQKNLKMFGLPELPNEIVFADTMDLMRVLKRKGIIKGGLSLKALLNEFSIKHNEKNQHDAWADTQNLIKVAQKAANLFGFSSYASVLSSNKHFMRSVSI